METFVSDIQYAARTAVRSPGLALTAILTLALGIGTTTAVFSVADAVLLRPLPYQEPERLVRVYEERAGASPAMPGHFLSNLTYLAWRDDTRTLEDLAAFGTEQRTILVGDAAARLTTASVTPSFFPVMGETPALGRFFTEAEGAAGGPAVVVLSDWFWRQQFGGDPGVPGRSLVSDGVACTVVGVARAGFGFPSIDAAFWTVQRVPPPNGEPARRTVSTLQTIGRLAAGVTAAQAADEGTARARSTGPQPMASALLFGTGGPPVVRAEPLLRELTAPVRPALTIAGTGVLLVLLLACANVANLLLSRGIARQRELAVRAALGAGRLRLIRQLLTESLVWCGAGGALGLGLAALLVASLSAAAPPDLPRFDGVALNGRVVGAAAGLSLLAAVLSGVLPALRGGALGVSLLTLRDSGISMGPAGRRAAHVRDLFLVGQATLAVVLAIGAALVARSFVNLTTVDAGYDPAHVLTARIHVRAEPRERGYRVLAGVLDRVRALPEVVAAGGGNMMPFSEATHLSAFELPSPATGDRMLARAREYAITPGYAEALGLELRDGRFFTALDAEGSTTPALVNEEFARLYLPPGPVAGRLIPTGLGSSDTPTVLVGVVRNVLKEGLAAAPQPDIYLPLRPATSLHEIVVVIRTAGETGWLPPTLREIVREADGTAAVAKIAPLASLVSTSVAQPRFTSMVMTLFAAMGLALASVGLYGALSFAVRQRRRELGIRAALGADRRRLMTLVLRHGLSVALVGVFLGCLAAAGLARLLSSTLFGVTPLDPVSYLTAVAVFGLTTLGACLRPALRAAAADPAETLREP